MHASLDLYQIKVEYQSNKHLHTCIHKTGDKKKKKER